MFWIGCSSWTMCLVFVGRRSTFDNVDDSVLVWNSSSYGTMWNGRHQTLLIAVRKVVFLFVCISFNEPESALNGSFVEKRVYTREGACTSCVLVPRTLIWRLYHKHEPQNCIPKKDGTFDGWRCDVGLRRAMWHQSNFVNANQQKKKKNVRQIFKYEWSTSLFSSQHSISGPQYQSSFCWKKRAIWKTPQVQEHTGQLMKIE